MYMYMYVVVQFEEKVSSIHCWACMTVSSVAVALFPGVRTAFVACSTKSLGTRLAWLHV